MNTCVIIRFRLENKNRKIELYMYWHSMRKVTILLILIENEHRFITPPNLFWYINYFKNISQRIKGNFVNEIYKLYEKSKRLQTFSNKFRANNIY